MNFLNKLFQNNRRTDFESWSERVGSKYDGSGPTCKKCGKPLIYASDPSILQWKLLNDSRSGAVAHRCEKCNSRFCASCMIDTRKSCIKCGGSVVNAL